MSWGVATLAEEVLANFFDPTRIEFFVDRDERKQGATCLGRPILSPETLRGKKRTVLVNSVDVADAIVGEIEAMQPIGGAHEIILIADLIDRLPRLRG